MGIFKSGFVTLVGRTNVGKSTLLNALVKEKIAITANKVQTTRTAIKAIITKEDYQIIITDTPGIHKPKSKLSETMIDTAFKMFQDVDVILFLIDATSKDIGKGDTIILDKIKESKKPCILLINKIDLVKKENILNLIEIYSKLYDFESIIPISAFKEEQIEKIVEEILKLLPEGPKYYNEDEYTDQTVRQISEEIIREKALKFLEDEIPHGIYVEIEDFKFRKNKNGKELYDINAIIYCQKDSHKGIIIGKNGNLLKKIATYSRQDIEKMLDMKVNLKVWVKVKNDWQNMDNIIKKFRLK